MVAPKLFNEEVLLPIRIHVRRLAT
jgi:hypothetical protein